MTLEMQILAWDRCKHVAGINRLMDPKPSIFDNCISNGNTYMNKRTNIIAQILFHAKRTYIIRDWIKQLSST
jgi:hypothetical protein